MRRNEKLRGLRPGTQTDAVDSESQRDGVPRVQRPRAGSVVMPADVSHSDSVNTLPAKSQMRHPWHLQPGLGIPSAWPVARPMPIASPDNRPYGRTHSVPRCRTRKAPPAPSTAAHQVLASCSFCVKAHRPRRGSIRSAPASRPPHRPSPSSYLVALPDFIH